MGYIIIGIASCLVGYFVGRIQSSRKDSLLEAKDEIDISRHRQTSERYLKAILENRRLMLRKDGYDPVFILVQNWYVRLGEIYRHDESKQREIISDWLRYLDHTSRAMVSHHAWLESLEKTEEDDRKHLAEQEKLHLELEEIENRFASLMGKEDVLEGCRLKAGIQDEYFAGSDNFNLLLTELYGVPETTDLAKIKKLKFVLDKMREKGEKITFNKRNKKLIGLLKTKLRIR